MKNSRIWLTVKCLVVLCLLSLLASYYLVFRGHNDMKTAHRRLESPHITLQVTVSMTTVQQSTTNSTTLLANQSESAFKRLGFASIDLMKKMESPRPLFIFTNTPWKVHCNDSLTTDENSGVEPRWSMIVGVKSHVDHFAERDVIRKTWGSYKFFKGVRLEVIFVVGDPFEKRRRTKLQAENEKHGDILQIHRKEMYQDVGLKTLSAMQWIGDHCPSHWIYSSSDDDMLPNLVSLYHQIETLIAAFNGRPKRTPISCGFSYRAYTHPTRTGEYINSLPLEVYPLNDYPPFCAGGFYSMPVGLSNAIYKISRHQKYFINDDVWITGLLRLSLVDSYPIYAQDFECAVSDKFCGISTADPGPVRHVGRQAVEREWKKIVKNFPVGLH